MRPLLALLFLCTAAIPAEPVERAQVCIERGLLYQRTLLDPAHAAAFYRRALTAPDATPRTSAEALWHLAANYADRGSNRVSLLALSKLQHDCPGVEPFARLAAAEAIGVSADTEEVSNPREGPNAVDLLAAQDTVRLVEAAVKLKSATATAALLERLQWHCDAMLFELSLAETTESADERRQRETSLELCREWLDWTQQARSAGSPALDDPIVAKLKDRALLADDPLLERIFAARDAFTAAMGDANAAAAKKSLTTLHQLLPPISSGPEDLLIVRSATGELAGAARALKLMEDGPPEAALLAWAETRRMVQESGAGSSGFRLNEMEHLPADILPEIAGALTYVESAIAALLNDGEDATDAAQHDLTTAVTQLSVAVDKCPAPAGKDHLRQTIRRLEEAGKKLEQGDTGAADSIMRSELYMSL